MLYVDCMLFQSCCRKPKKPKCSICDKYLRLWQILVIILLLYIAGYRCFRLVMFLTGFLTISILVYMVCLEVTSLKPLVIAGISLAAGLVAGLLTMCVQYIGFICAGFNLGFLISSAILIGVEQFYHLVTIWIPVGFILAVGTVFAILTLKFQKAFTIMQTSVFGGVLMISCIDYFIEQFLLMSYTWNTVRAEESWTPCWYSWIILGCWPFCFVVGTLAQWKITGHTYDHSQGLYSSLFVILLLKQWMHFVL